MNLTETIQKSIEAERGKPRDLTAAEKKARADFVAECRRANPYTQRFFNLTKQLRLALIDAEAATELRDAAMFEGIDDMKANPGLADDAKGSKGNDEG